MKGMIFVEVINDQIAGQGVVTDAVGPGFYKLTWHTTTPPLSRVISAERMQSMFLFNNPDEMDEWLKSVTKAGPANDKAPEKAEKKPARSRRAKPSAAKQKESAAASKDAE